MRSISKITGPNSLKQLWRRVNSNTMAMFFSLDASVSVGDATDAGKLRTNATATYKIGEFQYTKASTDNLWDMTAEVDTAAGYFRAYWLYLDNAGAATFVASSADQTSAAYALSSLPMHDETKSVIGVFVASPSCDFTNALVAQGTVYDGIPEGAYVGVTGFHYEAPELVSVV